MIWLEVRWKNVSANLEIEDVEEIAVLMSAIWEIIVTTAIYLVDETWEEEEKKEEYVHILFDKIKSAMYNKMRKEWLIDSDSVSLWELL